uniref:Uncharacterized protein n=1 Tax=Anguilla anguilla TaxID=7936 RepID=A0A0E9TCL9_ANGAN
MYRNIYMIVLWFSVCWSQTILDIVLSFLHLTDTLTRITLDVRSVYAAGYS